MGSCGIYHLVIKHGLLENPLTEWRFIARNIIDKWSIFQQARFDYRRLTHGLIVVSWSFAAIKSLVLVISTVVVVV